MNKNTETTEKTETKETTNIICAAQWRLTGAWYEFFAVIDKLFYSRKITKIRYKWLVKERPFKLIKELVKNHERTFAEKIRIDGFFVGFKIDNNDWVAYFKELPNISAYGNLPAEAIEELRIVWEAAKESYRKHGEEIPKTKGIE